jgi:hypothetical protein
MTTQNIASLDNIETLSKGLVVLTGSAQAATAKLILNPKDGSYTLKSPIQRHFGDGTAKYAFDVAGTQVATPTMLTRFYPGATTVLSAAIEPNSSYVQGIHVINSVEPYILNIELRMINNPGHYMPGIRLPISKDIDATTISVIGDLIVQFIRSFAPAQAATPGVINY